MNKSGVEGKQELGGLFITSSYVPFVCSFAPAQPRVASAFSPIAKQTDR